MGDIMRSFDLRRLEGFNYYHLIIFDGKKEQIIDLSELEKKCLRDLLN